MIRNLTVNYYKANEGLRGFSEGEKKEETNALGKLSRCTVDINYSSLRFYLLRLAGSKSLNFLRKCPQLALHHNL